MQKQLVQEQKISEKVRVEESAQGTGIAFINTIQLILLELRKRNRPCVAAYPRRASMMSYTNVIIPPSHQFKECTISH